MSEKKFKKSAKERFGAKSAPPSKKKRGITLPLVILSCAAIAGIAIGIFLFGKTEGGPPAVAAAEVTHPVEIFRDGKARHFEYNTGDGYTVRYFVLKSSDGVLRAAFDACDVCWPENKGYFQRGDYMVCRNCGRKFASIKVNEVKGGCNPAPLERSVVGEKLVIQMKDIELGKRYFNFAGGG